MNQNFKHWCWDWDGLEIGMEDSEIECCRCFSDIVDWHLVGIYRHLNNGDVYIEDGQYVWKQAKL